MKKKIKSNVNWPHPSCHYCGYTDKDDWYKGQKEIYMWCPKCRRGYKATLKDKETSK
jgi:hypothetical protein